MEHVLAIRLYARMTRDFERARVALESMTHIGWDPDGQPRLDPKPGMRDVEIGLADILLLSGQEARGRALLDAVIARYHDEVQHDGRSEYWYRATFPVALLLAGDREAAVEMLQARFEGQVPGWNWGNPIDVDPVLATLSDDPRYRALLERIRANAMAGHRKYERLVADGRVPDRRAAMQRN